MDEYRHVLGDTLPFTQRAAQLETDLQNARSEAKEALAEAPRKEKKRIEEKYQDIIESL